MKKLRDTKLGIIQLGKAKNQIKGYLARGYENHESLMLSLGKSLLVFGRIDTIEDICRKIDNVTASEILETANEFLNLPNCQHLFISDEECVIWLRRHWWSFALRASLIVIQLPLLQ